MGGFESSSERAQRVQEGRVWLEVHFGEQGGVRSPFKKARRGQEGWERSGDHLGRAGRSSKWARRGREAFLEGWEWAGGPFGGLREVGRPSQRAVRDQEALPEGSSCREDLLEGRERSGGLPGEVVRPSWRLGWGWEALSVS